MSGEVEASRSEGQVVPIGIRRRRRRRVDEDRHEDAVVDAGAVGHVIAVQDVDVGRRSLLDVVESVEVHDSFHDGHHLRQK